jgi:hypothetical protein
MYRLTSQAETTTVQIQREKARVRAWQWHTKNHGYESLSLLLITRTLVFYSDLTNLCMYLLLITWEVTR